MPISPINHKPAQHKATTHQSTDQPASNAWREWYTHSRWRKTRKQHLEREPLCRFCMDKGRVTEAVICDHAQPHKGNKTAFYAGPFISLCKLCHDSTKKRIENRRQAVSAQPRTYTIA